MAALELPGKSVICLAGSQSLVLLEIMVHLNNYRLLASYAMFAVRIPGKVIADFPGTACRLTGGSSQTLICMISE